MIGPVNVPGAEARREDWLGVGGVRRRGGFLDVAARVGARVDHPSRFEPAPYLEKPGSPFRLPVGGRRAADVGALRPGKPQPAEIIDRGGDKLLPAAGGVEILDAEDEPRGAGPRRGDGEGAGMADMEEAGRRRREPAPSPRKRIGLSRAWRGITSATRHRWRSPTRRGRGLCRRGQGCNRSADASRRRCR